MLRDLLKRLRTTVLLVTHDLDEALYLANHIVLVSEGRVVANLARDEFLQSDMPEIVAYASAFRRGQSAAMADPIAKGGIG
jgi:osmoprotectant transport system ATP-binding protein